MSTRCMVKVIFKTKEVNLYHHCDGYPEGVGFCLLKIMDKFKKTKNRMIINDMVKKGDFEITFGNHCDIEYYYELNFDLEQVRCMSVNNWGKEMEILDTIELKYDSEKDVHIDEEIFK